jgi:16S rRNA C967 or C1407 C5-methylase (RsmB/RsmF family)
MTTKTTFKEKFKMITGLNDEVVTQLLSYSHKSILVLNTLKANWQEVLDEIHKHATLIPLSDAKYCYRIESGKDRVTALPFFKDGNYYILNYSSLIPPLAVVYVY